MKLIIKSGQVNTLLLQAELRQTQELQTRMSCDEVCADGKGRLLADIGLPSSSLARKDRGSRNGRELWRSNSCCLSDRR